MGCGNNRPVKQKQCLNVCLDTWHRYCMLHLLLQVISIVDYLDDAGVKWKARKFQTFHLLPTYTIYGKYTKYICVFVCEALLWICVKSVLWWWAVADGVQPTGDGEAVDINLVTRLQQRVKELEWERSALQSEMNSQLSNNTEHSSDNDRQPSKEVLDTIKVWSVGKYCFLNVLVLQWSVSFKSVAGISLSGAFVMVSLVLSWLRLYLGSASM